MYILEEWVTKCAVDGVFQCMLYEHRDWPSGYINRRKVLENLNINLFMKDISHGFALLLTSPLPLSTFEVKINVLMLIFIKYEIYIEVAVYL
jgi:hypothetical protein